MRSLKLEDQVVELNDGLGVGAHITLDIAFSQGAVVEELEFILGDTHHFAVEVIGDLGFAAHEPEVSLLLLLLAGVDHGEALVVGIEHNVVGVISLLAEERNVALSNFGVGAVSGSSDTEAMVESLVGALTGVGDSEFARSVKARVLGSVAGPAVGLERLTIDVDLLVPDAHVGSGIEAGQTRGGIALEGGSGGLHWSVKINYC